MTATSLGKLTRRADYLAANGGRRAPTPGFILLVRPRGDGDPALRLGITVSRKVGGAVVRNRMRRRFRELARAILPQSGIAGADHVLIGRAGGIERPFAELRADLEKALRRVAGGSSPGREGGARQRGGVSASERHGERRSLRAGTPLHQPSAGPPPPQGEDQG